MIRMFCSKALWAPPMTVVGCLLMVTLASHTASAINLIDDPTPRPGSYGLEATKKKAAPTTAATITTPGNGASFSTPIISVSGICQDGLLVQVYNNGVMVGSTMCHGGSFTVQVSLFAGVNELTAIVYDEIDQPGPVSNSITVTYTDTNFTAFGTLITLTSSYGRRSAAAGSELSWPLQLSGGTGPYAFSIDWGDGTAAELKSQTFTGLVAISHIYKKAGIYQLNITVTDVNGVSAFLQLVAVSNGKIDTTATASTGNDSTKTVTKVIWIPAVIALALLLPTYWLGRRSQLVSLHNKMLKERDSFDKK